MMIIHCLFDAYHNTNHYRQQRQRQRNRQRRRNQSFVFSHIYQTHKENEIVIINYYDKSMIL